MHLNHHQFQEFIRERQESMLAEAAASRLVCRTPARERIARSLRRVADRLDTRTAARLGRPCVERN